MMRLASHLVLHAVIGPAELRAELIRRLAVLVDKTREPVTKRNGVWPT